MLSAWELSCSFVAHQRCLEVFSHHEVSQHEVQAPQCAVEAGYGGKVCLRFCKGASPAVLTVVGGGGTGAPIPASLREAARDGQRWVVEDGKGLLERRLLEGLLGRSALHAEAPHPVPCQLSGRCGAELAPGGCEQPMVQAADMAPPRWYFGLLSPEARGKTAFGLVLSQPGVVRVQLAADHEAGRN